MVFGFYGRRHDFREALPGQRREICAETFGDPADPAVLLIHGGSASMLWWDERAVRELAAAGGT